MSSKWLFANYMDGYNGIDFDSEYDIQQLLDVGSTDTVDIYIERFYKHTEGTPKSRFTGEGTFRCHVPRKGSQYTFTKLPENIATSEGQPLIDFMNWVFAENTSATYVALATAGHGSGAGGLLPAPPAPPDPHERWMRIPTLGKALNTVAKSHQKIDLYAMDDCNMASLEVAYEIKDAVDYCVFSELELTYFPFGAAARFMNAANNDPEKVAKHIPVEFIEHTDYGKHFSAVDNTILGPLVTALKNFSNVAQKIFSGELKPALAAAFFQSENNTRVNTGVDIFAFMDSLSRNFEAQLEAAFGKVEAQGKSAELKSAIEEVAKYAPGNPDSPIIANEQAKGCTGLNGLNVVLAYDMIGGYDKQSFAVDADWIALQKAYADAVSG